MTFRWKASGFLSEFTPCSQVGNYSARIFQDLYLFSGKDNETVTKIKELTRRHNQTIHPVLLLVSFRAAQQWLYFFVSSPILSPSAPRVFAFTLHLPFCMINLGDHNYWWITPEVSAPRLKVNFLVFLQNQRVAPYFHHDLRLLLMFTRIWKVELNVHPRYKTNSFSVLTFCCLTAGNTFITSCCCC